MLNDSKPPIGSDATLLAHYNPEPPEFRKNGKPKFYKPFILWTSSLSFLLVVTIVLIAVVELACQKLPNAENRGLVGSFNNRTNLINELLPRQNDGTAPDPDPNETPANAQISLSTEIAVISGVTRTVEVTYEYGEMTSTTTVTPTPSVVTSTVTSDGTESVFTTTLPVAQSTGGVKQSAWLRKGTYILPITAPVVNPGADPTPVVQPPVNPAEPVNPTVPVVPGTAPNTIVNPGQATTEPAVPKVSAATFIPVATSVTDKLGNLVATTVPVALDSAGSTISVPTGLISADATTTFILTPTKSAKPATKSGTTGNSVNSAADGAQGPIHVFTERDYVTGAFIPTIIAVLFVIPWGLINAAAKEMEPIYQMAVRGGAPASMSLALDYANSNMFVVPFQAFSRRHWVIFLTSILATLSLASAPLASESIFISLSGTCNAQTDSLQCIPTLSVYKTAARVLESVLAFMAILLGLVIYLSLKRNSNVLAEPISIAGVASLMHNQEFLTIVRDLPSYGVKEKDLQGMLPPANYTIGHYQNNDGTWGYGIMISRDSATPHYNYTTGNAYANVNLNNQLPSADDLSLNDKVAGFWTRFFRLFQVLGFMILLIGILALVAYWRFVDTEGTGFWIFMSNQRFGVKFLFTSLGVIIAQFWAYARDKIHRNEPYHSLTTLKSSPRKSILTSPALAPITSLYTSITLLSPLLIFLDLSTILADGLIITLSNVPYSSATTYEAWTVCSYLSLFFLAFMVATLALVVLRIGRFGAAEAGGEAPVTVLGKGVLVCGSAMLERFEGLGEVKGRERDKRVKSWGKLYGLGRVRGVDGVARRGVDFGENVNVGG